MIKQVWDREFRELAFSVFIAILLLRVHGCGGTVVEMLVSRCLYIITNKIGEVKNTEKRYVYQHLILSRVLATAPPEGGFSADVLGFDFSNFAFLRHSESACQSTQGYDIIAGIELGTSRRGFAVLVLVDWQDRAGSQGEYHPYYCCATIPGPA